MSSIWNSCLFCAENEKKTEFSKKYPLPNAVIDKEKVKRSVKKLTFYLSWTKDFYGGLVIWTRPQIDAEKGQKKNRRLTLNSESWKLSSVKQYNVVLWLCWIRYLHCEIFFSYRLPYPVHVKNEKLKIIFPTTCWF